jgi:hypothetical protein
LPFVIGGHLAVNLDDAPCRGCQVCRSDIGCLLFVFQTNLSRSSLRSCSGDIRLDGLRPIAEFRPLSAEFEEFHFVRCGRCAFVPEGGIESRDLLASLGQSALLVPQTILRARHFPVEFPKRALQFSGSAVGPGNLGLEFDELLLFDIQGRSEFPIFPRSEPDPQLAETIVVFLALLSFGCLNPECAELSLKPTEPILRTGDVGFDRDKLAESFGLPCLEPADPGCLIENFAAIARGCLKEFIHPTLSDDRVASRSGTAAQKYFLEIFETCGVTVDQVFARAIAVDSTSELNFIRIDCQKSAGVIERDRDLGQPQAFAGTRSIEDHIGHLSAAETFGRLFSENPPDGIDDIRFPGPVWSDNTSDARCEVEPGLVRERFEPNEFEALQHGFASIQFSAFSFQRRH